MASFVHNNWKGHLGISVSELCFKNALGLLINNRSEIREEWIIVWKFGMNHRASEWSFEKWIKTIGATKMRGNFVEILFQAKLLRKATKSHEKPGSSLKFVCITFAQYCNCIFQRKCWWFVPSDLIMVSQRNKCTCQKSETWFFSRTCQEANAMFIVLFHSLNS